MPTLVASTIVNQLLGAGLNLSLAPSGKLAVTPSSRLTADLRDLILSSKALLIDWLTSANDASSHALDQPDNPLDWKELAAAYHAHHFSCAACIAAGRSNDQMTRCQAGVQLWDDFQQNCLPVPSKRPLHIEVTV